MIWSLLANRWLLGGLVAAVVGAGGRCRAVRYVDACNAYTRYKFSGGYDCSTTINGQPNKRCWGVWKRSLERRDRCLAAQ